MTSRELTIGPHKPYWRTNSSFSPPPPRWDNLFQTEGVHYGSDDSIQLLGSMSSNSKESMSWMRGGYHQNQQYYAAESGIVYCSSPSETSLIHPWTPPPTREINNDDFEVSTKRDVKSGPLCFTPTMEGTSMETVGGGSTSSRSDGSEFELTGKLHFSTPRNFPSRRSFMSKPIHPLSIPVQAPRREAFASLGSGLLEYGAATPQRESHRISSDSGSVDLADTSEPFEADNLHRASNQCETVKCGLCDRLLSQRSPWRSKSGEVPVTGVLSCSHVFHAECLEQTTPKTLGSDPPCPICTKVEGNTSPDQRVFPKTYNSFPRLRAFSEEGTSRSWGCIHASDCVEGALHVPQRSSMLLLNRNRVKKSLSSKGNPGKDFPGKPKKTSSYPLNLFGGRSVNHAAGGCSKTAASSSTKK